MLNTNTRKRTWRSNELLQFFYGCIIGIGCHLVSLVHLLRHLVFVSFITISLHIDHTLDGLTTVCAHVQFTRNLHFPVSEFHSRITAIFHQNAMAKRQQRWMTNEKKLLPHSTRAPAMLFLPANLPFLWRNLCWWKFRSIFIIWVFEILLRILQTKRAFNFSSYFHLIPGIQITSTLSLSVISSIMKVKSQRLLAKQSQRFFPIFFQRTILTKTTINTEKEASNAFSNWQTN